MPERLRGLAALLCLALQGGILFLAYPLPILLALHGLLSVAIAWALYPLLPSRARNPRLAALCFLGLLDFLLPVAGPVALVLALHAARYFPQDAAKQHFQDLASPEFTAQGDHTHIHFGAGGIRARLADHKASAETRLEALLAIKAMPQKLSGSVLRDLLDDPEEDLRLLAYGMLDSEEKAINANINAALAAYASEPLASARKLGFLYWELIYHKLAQGDVRAYALHEAARYVDEVLLAQADDAGMWVLRGKIHNASHEGAAGLAALLHAAELGFPRSRLIPYLAEHAYERRDFAAVRKLLQELGPLAIGDTLQPITTYWTRTP